jgi:hypothetical protein
MARYAREVLTA